MTLGKIISPNSFSPKSKTFLQQCLIVACLHPKITSYKKPNNLYQLLKKLYINKYPNLYSKID